MAYIRYSSGTSFNPQTYTEFDTSGIYEGNEISYDFQIYQDEITSLQFYNLDKELSKTLYAGGVTAVDFNFSDNIAVVYAQGGLYDDRLTTGSADDFLTGGSGNDTLDGGDGSDTAIYSSQLGNYTVTRNSDGSLTVTDWRVGPNDGTDTVSNVEFLRFGKTTYSADEIAPPANRAPVANDDAASVLQRGEVSGDVIYGHAPPKKIIAAGVVSDGRDVDADGDALSVGAVSVNGGAAVVIGEGAALAGRHGTLTIDHFGDYTYVADGTAPIAVGATVTDTFTYTVSDDRDGTDTADLVVTVTGTSEGTDGADTFYLTGPGTTATGGKGDDTYFVNGSSDRPVEEAGGGTDTVRSSVSYTLAANVETLILSGSNSTKGTGDASANTILGNGGNNVLDGGLGNDTLNGLSGRDTFQFSTKLGSGNVDHITAFSVTDDTIALENGIFKGLKAGTLNANVFKDIGDGAKLDANDRILYNHDTGVVSYDADGSGSQKAVAFAVLDNHPSNLTFQDFQVV